MLTVYYTRWWERQKFITMFILIIDATYSHNYRCVYVVYPNMLTIPGATRSLISGGGGFIPGMGNTKRCLFVDWLSPWSLFRLNVALYQFLPLSRGQGRFNLNNDRIFQLLFSSTGYFRKLYLSLQVRVLWNILKYLSIDSYFEISSGTLLRIKL